jgi:hypothetical protein
MLCRRRPGRWGRQGERTSGWPRSSEARWQPPRRSRAAHRGLRPAPGTRRTQQREWPGRAAARRLRPRQPMRRSVREARSLDRPPRDAPDQLDAGTGVVAGVRDRRTRGRVPLHAPIDDPAEIPSVSLDDRADVALVEAFHRMPDDGSPRAGIERGEPMERGAVHAQGGGGGRRARGWVGDATGAARDPRAEPCGGTLRMTELGDSCRPRRQRLARQDTGTLGIAKRQQKRESMQPPSVQLTKGGLERGSFGWHRPGSMQVEPRGADGSPAVRSDGV